MQRLILLIIITLGLFGKLDAQTITRARFVLSPQAEGSLKTIGDMAIRYYNTFDIHDPKEKVKSVGKVQIKYYTEFDAGNNFGGIKSVTGNTSALTVSAGRRYKLYSGRG